MRGDAFLRASPSSIPSMREAGEKGRTNFPVNNCREGRRASDHRVGENRATVQSGNGMDRGDMEVDCLA